MIRVCVAGCTGWTGSKVTQAILKSPKFKLSAAIARKSSGKDIGTLLGHEPVGLQVVKTLSDIQVNSFDVLIDYTKPDSVKSRILEALQKRIHVVVGTSGLSAADYVELDKIAVKAGVGIIAAGNFSVTAALAKHFALIAAKFVPTWEIIDYAQADKPDAPSGTTRELAESLSNISQNQIELPIDKTLGLKEARGAAIAGTQVHSLRIPGFVLSFETIFGMPNERLSIRHDAGAGADPYVMGTLLAAERVTKIKGLIRGLDALLFHEHQNTS